VIQGYSQYSGGLSYDELAIEEQSKTDIYALDAQNRPYAPAWQTFNVKAQYSLDAHIDLIAGIENITDQRYRTYSSGISAAGRNLILALRAQI
jgi:hemoglobin/transferrin/lactoferrin receptor protein